MQPPPSNNRIFNFSPGPATLPESVLQKAASELVALPGVGSSILEVSHRGPVFTKYMNLARDGLRTLLAVPEDYEILFLQGGSRLQFAMIPMNFQRPQEKPAAYAITGSWGKKAFSEAQVAGNATAVWDGGADHYRSLPEQPFNLDPNQYSYCYYVSNETIQGVQFADEPDSGKIPLVCDASSDFLHKPLDISKYALLYACAQKNAGAAGVTIVIVRKDFVESARPELPGYLSFGSHVENQSLYNTPPTFAIYILALIVQWLIEDVGGLKKMHSQNLAKAQRLYEVIDQYQGLYTGHAEPHCRSLMNVVFRLKNESLLDLFLKEAEQNGLASLAGHRSVGGIRASIYNAMPVTGVDHLAEYMADFAAKHA